MCRLKHQARTRIWLIPLLGLLAGLGLAVVTVAVDRAHHFSLVSQAVTGTPTDVQTTLSTAGTALVTLTTWYSASRWYSSAAGRGTVLAADRRRISRCLPAASRA